jgi:response regulator of citrate/malate metabolism
MATVKRILIVEDDLTIYPLISRMVQQVNPHAVIEFAASAEKAQELIRDPARKYAVILSDVHLAGAKTGLDLVKESYFTSGRTPMVLASADTEFQTRLPYLAKPFRADEVANILRPFLDDDAAPVKTRGGNGVLKILGVALGLVVLYFVLARAGYLG